MKYTCLFLTINTNVPFITVGYDEKKDFAQSIAYLCKNASEIFKQPVLECKPSELGVEIGHKQHRLHAHVLLTLTTPRGFRLQKVNANLQEYYNSLPYGIFHLSAGVYVQAKLHSRSAILNYAQKEGGTHLASRTISFGSRR